MSRRHAPDIAEIQKDLLEDFEWSVADVAAIGFTLGMVLAMAVFMVVDVMGAP